MKRKSLDGWWAWASKDCLTFQLFPHVEMVSRCRMTPVAESIDAAWLDVLAQMCTVCPEAAMAIWADPRKAGLVGATPFARADGGLLPLIR